MGSDLARVSFDRSRGYRSVIVQQGRVTLEADVNEAAALAAEALRYETIDVIGPAGTPDNGYEVRSGSSVSDIVIGAGTMYVGGWRMRLEQPVHLNDQPDWRNLVAPAAPQAETLVALLVTEQSVSAVEDNALYEVALGGPDTAARSRLMQHFLALPVDAKTCELASDAVATLLAENGLSIDPRTLAVTSDATLSVGFVKPTAPPDPCDPVAQGGYLGADNQMVRVSIASYDRASGQGWLVWGWNNASVLYRAKVVDAQTLALGTTPLDVAHTPQPGQAIEVLRTACVLGATADRNYIAAPQGVVMNLGGSNVYSAANNQISLPQPLPPDYQSEPNSLFVRLWQAQVAFTSGTVVSLDGVSGLNVTVTVPALPSGVFTTATPFWRFAVRPNTPQQVYPMRYLTAQPPDGPRQWLCDLAVVLAASVWPAGRQINPANTTPLAPAAAVFNDQLYVFWRSDDSSDHVFFSASADGATWPAGQTINASSATQLAPAACVFDGKLYVFWQAEDGGIAYSASADGSTWPAGQTINGTDTTSATPAACVFNGKLYLFWNSSDQSRRIFASSSSDGVTWPAGEPIVSNQPAQGAPAACVFEGHLYLFWSAASSNEILFSASSDGATWPAGTALGSSDTTPLAPAATVYDGELFLFWRANDASNDIYTTASSDGASWAPPRRINGADSTPQPLATASFNGELYLFWTANDSSNTIYTSATTGGMT